MNNVVSIRHISIAVVLSSIVLLPGKAGASSTEAVGSPFLYNFNTNGTLFESRTLDNSTSPYFWLSSGAELVIEDGVGKTIQGPLSDDDLWREIYKRVNPVDTLGGLYPQNAFNLVTRSFWNNLTQELDFKVSAANIVDSPNRDGYSGLFLLSRFKDESNFYEAGIRMDGLAVVKKRVGGIYYTLGTAEVFGRLNTYDRDKNPNLIPIGQQMSIKSETKDLPNGDVSITLWIDQTESGTWTQILSVTDKQAIRGTTLLKGRAYAGIHSDFLDAVFDNYKLTEL